MAINRQGHGKITLSAIDIFIETTDDKEEGRNQEANDNLDPNEITRLFDESEIQQVAAHTGANEMEVRQGLAELLPEVMNQLTPNGNLDNEPEANEEIDQIMNQLSSRLGTLK
mgnify:CR=1 FL=1